MPGVAEREGCTDLLDLMMHFKRWLDDEPEQEEILHAAIKAVEDARDRFQAYIEKKQLNVTVDDLVEKALEKHAQGGALSKVELILVNMAWVEERIDRRLPKIAPIYIQKGRPMTWPKR